VPTAAARSADLHPRPYWLPSARTRVLLEVVCHDRGWTGAGVRAVSGHGTAIMRLVRRVIVGQPLVSDHREASRLGRLVGRAIVERTPTSSSRWRRARRGVAGSVPRRAGRRRGSRS